jgi:hypothetical protein
VVAWCRAEGHHPVSGSVGGPCEAADSVEPRQHGWPEQGASSVGDARCDAPETRMCRCGRQAASMDAGGATSKAGRWVRRRWSDGGWPETWGCCQCGK